MNAIVAVVLAQIATGAQEILPVLAFPEPGLDDSAAYEGYRTRFLRDAAGNVVQIYISQRDGRVVHLWADAANASAAFSARDAQGRPAALSWDSNGAAVDAAGGVRSLEYRLAADPAPLEIGAFLLGSMRLERDFQYREGHRAAFGTAEIEQPELLDLIANLGRLPAAERAHHLRLLRASSAAELRARLRPTLRLAGTAARPVLRLDHATFDGRNRMALQLTIEDGAAVLDTARRAVVIRPRTTRPIRLLVRIETDAPTLSPLRTSDIFDDEFMAFVRRVRAAGAAPAAPPASASRARRLERQVRSAELMSYEEKLMAGLPNYATYFGRDMIMSALMMEPIWTPAMLEHVIAAVLRKLAPTGEVSHEEALGGQAIRENAGEYNARIDAYFAGSAGDPARADSLLLQARSILADLQAVRENYHMVDDDFQFPVLAARYLNHASVGAARKRAFLLASDSPGTGPRLDRLLRNMAYIVHRTEPYARDPRPMNLIGFTRRSDGRWASQSWRDSGAGYGNGRFAMDVNAIWVPAALEAIDTIFRVLRSLGLQAEVEAAALAGPELTVVREYAADGERRRVALGAWREARRHFEVGLSLSEARGRAQAFLATLPGDEREFWREALETVQRDETGVRFLALALDSAGAPIPVVNTDPATGLFLSDHTARVVSGASAAAEVLEQVRPFMLRYPLGLFIPGLGAVVANDAYAAADVRAGFRQDLYHSPRVVWGREVNLLLLGLAHQIAAAFDPAGRLRDAGLEPYVRELGDALTRTVAAVEESGLKHNELWTYRIENGELMPVRYGASTDIQLWNLTDLAVQFALDRLPAVGERPR